MRQGFYTRNHVPVIHGQARFLEPTRIEVEKPDGRKRILNAKHTVLAVGARPYRPTDVSFAHPRIFDSDTILEMSFTPKSMMIYGAGVIGCEYASMFRNLGMKINLVNTRDKLLDFLDDEIIDALSYYMRDTGIVLRHRESYASIEGQDDGVVLVSQSGKRLKSDVLLWANGRTGNTDDLGLENVGLQPNSRGQLRVDEKFQTEVPHIFAVGDVIGFPSLASARLHAGTIRSNAYYRLGRRRLSGDHRHPGGHLYEPRDQLDWQERNANLPSPAFPTKSASHRSRTWRALRFWAERSECSSCFSTEKRWNCWEFTVSVLAQPRSSTLARQSCPNLETANSLMYFINTTFNYPTMAEAYRVAALNGYNRLF